MKRFRLDKCPYKQLKEHKGNAIIYVDGDCSEDHRVRVVNSSGLISWASTAGKYNYPEHKEFRVSFYFGYENNRIGNIQEMKEYDRQYGLGIVHVEFH